MKYEKVRYQENPKIKINYQKRRYQETPQPHEKYEKIKYLKCQENKKSDKVENFLYQIKQGPHYICTIFHNYEKYILMAEFCHPVKSFDEELYNCETCHTYLPKKEIPCQAVCNNPNFEENFVKK